MATQPPPHTLERLTNDLRQLGVEAGDILFIHSSFKSLGPVVNGAETVVCALEAAVGPQGLILMPSFNLTEGDRTATWKGIETTPATTGWLTEYFRRMPGTLRSDHYSHSVAARGPRAAEFVGEHLRREGARSIWDREPWGHTYGRTSPFQKAYDAGGKLLMIGVDYHSATFVHLVETLHWNRRLVQEPAAPFRTPFTRPWLGAWWDSLGRLAFGKVGDANCRLFAIRDFVDTLLAAVDADPDRWDKWSPSYADNPGPESGFPGPSAPIAECRRLRIK